MKGANEHRAVFERRCRPLGKVQLFEVPILGHTTVVNSLYKANGIQNQF